MPIEPPEPYTPKEEVAREILTAPLDTDADYERLGDIVADTDADTEEVDSP